MKFNKWWGLLVGLIIMVGFLMGGYTESENLVIKNLVGLVIMAIGFAIGWWWERQEKRQNRQE